jgi:hypothetical protein
VTLWECMSTLEISPRGCCCKFVAFPSVGVIFYEFTLRGPLDLVLAVTTVWEQIHMFDQIKNGMHVNVRDIIHEPLLECMSMLEISPRGCRCKLVAFPSVVVMLFELTLLGPSDLLLVTSTIW